MEINLTKVAKFIGIMALGAVTLIVSIYLFAGEDEIENQSLRGNYDYDYREAYLEGCVDGSTSSFRRDFCECTYDTLARKYGVGRIVEIGLEYNETGVVPQEMNEAVNECF